MMDPDQELTELRHRIRDIHARMYPEQYPRRFQPNHPFWADHDETEVRSGAVYEWPSTSDIATEVGEALSNLIGSFPTPAYPYRTFMLSPDEQHHFITVLGDVVHDGTPTDEQLYALQELRDRIEGGSPYFIMHRYYLDLVAQLLRNEVAAANEARAEARLIHAQNALADLLRNES